MDVLTSFLGRNGYVPHGWCLSWSPTVLWSMVGADTVIAAAYFSIPLAILNFARQRPDPLGGRVAWMFSAFIFACGLTHVMDVWTLWNPDYGPQALTKVVTAAVSLLTAVVLWRLIPRALQIPSVGQLRTAIESLEAEVRRRRTAEEHLADLQQALAMTLASIDAGFIAADAQGRVTRLNAVAERVTGWTEAQAQGRSLWQVFQREGRPPEIEQRNPVEVMAGRALTVQDVQRVVAVSREGGLTTPLELRAGLTRADDGSVRGVTMIFRDVTRQMQAEDDASRLAAIVESSNDAIIGKTLDGRITSWNRAAQEMFGYSPQEAMGMQVQRLIPPEREFEEMRILAELAHGSRVPAFDTVRQRKDGSLLDVSISISPIRDARGLIVGASKIARDVTPQRRAEEALRESEARLRFTLEAAQIGDWELDLESGRMRRSPRHDRCFGYDTPQPDWTFETLLAHVHPRDRDEVEHHFRIARRALGVWGVECRVVWPDGSLHWIASHGRVRQLHGRPTHLLGIVSDITAQKLEEAARLTAQRLEDDNRRILEASRVKSQFLANMSHELRTPLNAVIGFAELMLSGAVPPESPRHQHFLGHIATSGRHLLKLINDVLDLSKVEAGKFEFFPEPVQLAPLVAEAFHVVQGAAARKKITLVADIAPNLGAPILDPARLKQVLYNYLSNALKFTPDGGTVTLRARAEGDTQVRIEVEDTGIGIASSDLPRLFTEFQQLDAGHAKRHAGTGLGLALTRRLVQAQGGSVGVHSVPGVGSVFHLVLPREPQAVAGPAEGLATPHRLLVIEHDAARRARQVQGLAQAGFSVDGAGTGEQALRQASQQRYAALMLALRLPDQQGLGLLADIRSAGASRAAPVVGVTMPDEAGAAACFAVADVLAKPLRTDEVTSAMAHLRGDGPVGLRVLVIDDDPLALDLMCATLSRLGMAATGVQDGRAALRELDRHRPDAIVLDLVMPGFDGFAVLDALRSMPQWMDTPVYIWTSLLLSEDEYATLAQSARAVLNKGGGALDPVLERLRHWRPPAERLESAS